VTDKDRAEVPKGIFAGFYFRKNDSSFEKNVFPENKNYILTEEGWENDSEFNAKRQKSGGHTGGEPRSDPAAAPEKGRLLPGGAG
jgi:hypothetical protein